MHGLVKVRNATVLQFIIRLKPWESTNPMAPSASLRAISHVLKLQLSTLTCGEQCMYGKMPSDAA